MRQFALGLDRPRAMCEDNLTVPAIVMEYETRKTRPIIVPSKAGYEGCLRL
jgi:hypothetical protein